MANPASRVAKLVRPGKLSQRLEGLFTEAFLKGAAFCESLRLAALSVRQPQVVAELKVGRQQAPEAAVAAEAGRVRVARAAEGWKGETSRPATQRQRPEVKTYVNLGLATCLQRLSVSFSKTRWLIRRSSLGLAAKF